MFDSHSFLSYPSGELVPQTGHYLAHHPSGVISYGEILFQKGEPFPLCSRCDGVRYTLLPSVTESLTLRKTGKRSHATIRLKETP